MLIAKTSRFDQRHANVVRDWDPRCLCFDQRHANVVGDWDPRCLRFDQRHANVVEDWDLRGSRSAQGNRLRSWFFHGEVD